MFLRIVSDYMNPVFNNNKNIRFISPSNDEHYTWGKENTQKKCQCGIRTEKIYNNIVEENKFMTEYNCRLRKDKQ